MYRYVEKLCPYCKAEFKENDDIVVCSECDMPHHRDCWIQNQGCTTFGCLGTMKTPDNSPSAVTNQLDLDFDDIFLENQSHGANYQYNNYSNSSSFYGGNNYPANYNSQQNFQNFDNSNYISNVVSLVEENESYYASKFQEMKQQNKKSTWNWSAFLFAPYWCIYRKMYLYGVALMGSLLLFSLLSSVLFSIVSLAVYIVFGIYGNYIYMDWLEKKISTSNSYGQLATQNLQKYKGVNQMASALSVIGFLFVNFVIMLL